MSATEWEEYTLYDFYIAAAVSQDVEWAKAVRMRFIPDPHQIAALNQMLQHERYGLYDWCDLGKTLPFQAYLLLYAMNGYRCLLVTLPILIRQFTKSLAFNYENAHQLVKVHEFTQPPAGRKKLYAKWQDSGNYPHILSMSFEVFSKEWSTLLDHRFGCLMCDEADRLCNPDTFAHKAVRQYVNTFDHMRPDDKCALVLVTGTPLRKDQMDAYGLIAIVTPGVYVNKAQFEMVHGVAFAQVGKGEKKRNGGLVAFHNNALLSKNLYLQARRVTKMDVGRDQRPRMEELQLVMYPEHRALYRRLIKERLLMVDGELIDAVSQSALRAIAMQMITTPHRYADADAKIHNVVFETLQNYVNSLDEETHEKVIIVSHFKETTDFLFKQFEHLQPARLYGKITSVNRREAEKERFIGDSGCRILLGNAESMGAGVDGLQHVCSKMVITEPMTTPRTFVQLVERINRRGQPFQVHVKFFNVLGTITSKFISVMLGRNEEIKEVTLDKYTFLDELFGGEQEGSEPPF